MDTKQLLIALIELALMTLRQDSNAHGSYDNGAQYRIDLALTSIRARLFDGVHDEETVGQYLDAKHTLWKMCHVMREALSLEKSPVTHRIEHTTDARIEELFGNIEGRLASGDFDNMLALLESMAIASNPFEAEQVPPEALELAA